jgi:hypothetical protein
MLLQTNSPAKSKWNYSDTTKKAAKMQPLKYMGNGFIVL